MSLSKNISLIREHDVHTKIRKYLHLCTVSSNFTYKNIPTHDTVLTINNVFPLQFKDISHDKYQFQNQKCQSMQYE